MSLTAYCTKAVSEVNAIAYTFAFTPSCVWGEHTFDEAVIRQRAGSTCIYVEGARLQCRDQLGPTPMSIDQFLIDFCGATEPYWSQLRRRRGQWEDLGQCPDAYRKYIPYFVLWEKLADAQKIALAVVLDDMIEHAESMRRLLTDDDESDDEPSLSDDLRELSRIAARVAERMEES